MGNNLIASFLERNGSIIDKLTPGAEEQADRAGLDEVTITEVADTIKVASPEKLFNFFDDPGNGAANRANPPCADTFGTSDITKVRSLNFEKYIANDIKGLWGFAVSKLNQWDNHLAELAKFSKKQEDIDHIKYLQTANWDLIRQQKTKDYLTALDLYSRDERLKYQTPETVVRYISGHNTILVDETPHIDALKGKNFGLVKGIYKEFADAMLKFYKCIVIYVEEKTEFQRFNSLFSSQEVAAVINQIPHVKFTACELKALCAQETGDFNDTKIYGVHTKTKGMLRPTGNNANYVGLGQIGVGAVGDALEWAKGKGLTVNFDKTNRSIEPRDSVVLAACYLGTLTERYLLKLLPDPKPTCTEFKKLVFAAYNSTFNRVVSSAKDYQAKTKDANYSWEKIKSYFADETKNYVPQIIERLNV
jgi:hypothetical protein